MRRISFIITIIGIFILLIFLPLSSHTPISSPEELEDFLENKKVSTTGQVTSQRSFGDSQILTLNNSIELICDCQYYLGKNISVLGTIDRYQNKERIQVLRIKKA